MTDIHRRLADQEEARYREAHPPANDDLAPAKGITLGFIVALAMWFGGAAIVWAVWTETGL